MLLASCRRNFRNFATMSRRKRWLGRQNRQIGAISANAVGHDPALALSGWPEVRAPISDDNGGGGDGDGAEERRPRL
jgi:hypothetical protein